MSGCFVQFEIKMCDAQQCGVVTDQHDYPVVVKGHPDQQRRSQVFVAQAIDMLQK